MADYSAFSEPVAKVYEECVDELLTAMAKHFGVSAVGGGTFDYEVRLLTKMGAITRECAQIIAKRSGYAQELAELGIEQSIYASVKQMEPYLKRAAQRGLLTAAEVPMEESVRRVLEAYSKQARVQMNLVNTVMLESTEQAMRAYAHDVGRRMSEAQRILNAETGEVIVGAKSLQEAVRDGVKKMNKNGLTGFIDHGGHHWSPEAYVRMDIQTTCANAANEAVFERNRSYGNDLVSVRVNRTAREKCYPWQGKVLSMDNNSPGTVRGYDGRVYEVTNIKDTSYGLPDGLWGINCHHSPANVFIPGMSDVHGVENMPSDEENRRMYALTQEQRKLEREVRLNKREAAMLHASGDKEGFEEAALKLKRTEKQLDEFVAGNQTVLVKKRDRTSVLEYNKDVAKNVRTVNNKYSRYHYHEDGTIVVTDDWKNKGKYHIPSKYKPYAVIESISGKKQMQIDRTLYDKDGYMRLQIHSGSHGNPGAHSYGKNGEHVHDYILNPNANKKLRTIRDMNENERRENADIL